jgi:DNA mismatch endonuclease (patch repair protein)
MPKTRISYWREKLRRNVERDAQNIERLGADGWEVLVVWECELNDMNALETRLRNFLNS